MPFTITENLINQLLKIFEKLNNVWCKIIIQTEDSDYISFGGFASTTQSNLVFEGLKKSEIMKLHFDHFLKEPVVVFTIDMQTEIVEIINNLYIDIVNRDILITNDWVPPNEVLYPGKPDVNFKVISQLNFLLIKEQIFLNEGKNILLSFTYFDEHINDLKAFLNGSKPGFPKTKNLSLKCFVKDDSTLVTLDNSLVSLIYVKILQVPNLIITGEKIEFDERLSDISFQVID